MLCGTTALCVYVCVRVCLRKTVTHESICTCFSVCEREWSVLYMKVSVGECVYLNTMIALCHI